MMSGLCSGDSLAFSPCIFFQNHTNGLPNHSHVFQGDEIQSQKVCSLTGFEGTEQSETSHMCKHILIDHKNVHSKYVYIILILI